MSSTDKYVLSAEKEKKRSIKTKKTLEVKEEKPKRQSRSIERRKSEKKKDLVRGDKDESSNSEENIPLKKKKIKKKKGKNETKAEMTEEEDERDIIIINQTGNNFCNNNNNDQLGGSQSSKEKNIKKIKQQKTKEHPQEINMFVERGFLEFYKNSVITDLVIKLGRSQEFKVHKLIVAHSSAYVYQVLQKNPEQLIEFSIEEIMDEIEGNNLMNVIISYMYTGTIQFTEQNCIVLLSFADKYEMMDLRQKAVEYITDNIERENALEMLKRALSKDLPTMVDKCIEVIARNFCYIYDADYSFLSSELFGRIIGHPKLNLQREFDLFKEIMKYIEKTKLNQSNDPESQAKINSLTSHIRFRWCSTDELQLISQAGICVSQDLLIESLFVKLREFENSNNSGPSPLSINNNPRLQMREQQGITFTYKSHYKKDPKSLGKGILHWLATSGGRSEHQNPHLTGNVIVQASSVEKGTPSELVGAVASELWTKDVPSSWFSIQFKNGRCVRPTSYCLRHGGNYRADSLRTWDFQGSTDGETWVTLRRFVISLPFFLSISHSTHFYLLVFSDTRTIIL